MKFMKMNESIFLMKLKTQKVGKTLQMKNLSKSAGNN